MKITRKTAACTILAAGLAATAIAQGASLTADFSKKTSVSDNLYGIFYEDINYAADGGLYGEMVQNRSFEFRKSNRSPTETWKDVNISGARSKSRLRAAKTAPLNENNQVYATLTVKQAGDGMANKGYGGMPFEAGKKYPGSLYLRSPDGTIKSVTITAGGSGKNAKKTKVSIDGITTEWKKFEFTIVPEETVQNGELAVCADTVGKLDADFISLFRADIYRNEPNGFRKDLAEKLEALKPAFVRFPGGCIVHGLNLENRYEWKDTVGPVEQRKEKLNFWGYQQSYGIGFYEYFRFCEDIGAEPLPVLSVGMAHNGEISPASDYQKYAQDALDMIEWATGPATSKWGKIRAEAGHPQPFKLNYLGIGNEDCGQDYFARFKYIAEAVKEKYPHIKTIISSGYTYNDVNFHNTWSQVRAWEKGKKTAGICDLVDEHYYNESAWFLTNGKRYDNLDFYPRGEGQPKVFIGEYASWVDGRRNNLYAALTEAAYMTSIERNGDIVEISSYAPLFAKEGSTQWVPDMIWFNNSESYQTPDYYVQQLFSTNKSDNTVSYSLTQPKTAQKKNAIGGTVGLGTWSTTAQFKDIKVTDEDSKEVLYDSNAKSSKISDFRQEIGAWSKSGPVIVQSSADINVRAVLNNEAQTEGIQNYTYELKAQKTGGAEGFLIMFGVKGKKLYWWNMGGWGNTQSCIEKGTADGRTIIGDAKPLNLVNGKWYDIKIEVKGDSYSCYLDGQLIHSYTDAMNFDPLYAHIGDTKDGKVIIKLVNVSGSDQNVDISLKNAPALETSAKATILCGKPEDENSFANPKKVSPVTETITGISDSFTYKTKANSVTVLKLKTKQR